METGEVKQQYLERLPRVGDRVEVSQSASGPEGLLRQGMRGTVVAVDPTRLAVDVDFGGAGGVHVARGIHGSKLRLVFSETDEIDGDDGREDYAVDITEALLIRAVALVSPVNAALLGARALRALSRGAKNLLVRLGTEVASGIKSAAQARREASREPELLQLVPLSEGGEWVGYAAGGFTDPKLAIDALFRGKEDEVFLKRSPDFDRDVLQEAEDEAKRRRLAIEVSTAGGGWILESRGRFVERAGRVAEHFTSQDDIIREIRSLRGRHPEAREHLDAALRYLDAPLNDGSRLHVGAALNRAADVFWDAELEDLAGRTVDMLAAVSPEMFRDVGYTE